MLFGRLKYIGDNTRLMNPVFQTEEGGEGEEEEEREEEGEGEEEGEEGDGLPSDSTGENGIDTGGLVARPGEYGPQDPGEGTLSVDLILAWTLYSGALILAAFALTIYIYSTDALLPSKYVPSTLDIPCMSAFFLIAVILVALGRSIELAECEDRFMPESDGVTDKVERLKRSKIYDRIRLNRLSEVDARRRSRKGSKRRP